MTEKEFNQAINALIDWLQSQQIQIEDAVPLLAGTIVAFIRARTNDPKAIKAGKSLVVEMIREF